jgi:hypothetical protein
MHLIFYLGGYTVKKEEIIRINYRYYFLECSILPLNQEKCHQLLPHAHRQTHIFNTTFFLLKFTFWTKDCRVRLGYIFHGINLYFDFLVFIIFTQSRLIKCGIYSIRIKPCSPNFELSKYIFFYKPKKGFQVVQNFFLFSAITMTVRTRRLSRV